MASGHFLKLQIRSWGNVLTAVRLRGLTERKLRERQPQSQGRMKATQNPSQGDSEASPKAKAHTASIWEEIRAGI